MFNFDTKLSVSTPKAEVKIESKKHRVAANSAISKGVIAASTEIEKKLNDALRKSLSSGSWDWPRETIRSNGSIAGTSRNIVDTGALRDSQKITTRFLKTKLTMAISYSAPHAGIVYYGGVIQPYGNPNANSVTIPGRPWVEAVLNGTHGQEKFDILTPFNRAINAAWGSAFG